MLQISNLTKSLQFAEIFSEEVVDYGASWRIFLNRYGSDFVKANASFIGNQKESRVGEVFSNSWGSNTIMGLIQLELGYSDTIDITAEKTLKLFANTLPNQGTHECQESRLRRGMAPDALEFVYRLILTKIYRIKEIEMPGKTLVS